MLKLRDRIITCILAVLTLFTTFTIIHSVAKADGDTVEYTNVLDDLKQDEDFKINQYPSIEKENTLQVIQIAESVNNELFIYVYAPSSRYKRLIANEIRMGLPQYGVDTTYKDYNLILLNTNGVFQKYKVVNLTLSKASVRYYDIIQLSRPIDYTIDEELDLGQTASNVPCPVSQKWEVTTVDNKTSYRMLTLETITITDKFVGFIRYDEGFKLYIDKCDSHFVAFNTDRNMEKLLEASITYVAQDYFYLQDGLFISGEEFGEPVTIPLELDYTQEASTDGDGLFGKKYTWKRIEKVQDFLNNEDSEDMTLTDKGSTELKKMQWILRFAETPYRMDILWDTDFQGNLYQSGYMYNQTHVSDVTILRLKFETDGKTYNLGVIDNKQTGSDEPVGTVEPDIGGSISSIFKKIFALFLIVLLAFGVVYLLIAFCPLLISLLGKIFTMIFKVIASIIAFPFKLIGKLFKRRKN